MKKNMAKIGQTRIKTTTTTTELQPATPWFWVPPCKTYKIRQKYEKNMKLYQQHENVVFEYLLHQGSHAMK